jgi:Domain of unknown function (DUF4271)
MTKKGLYCAFLLLFSLIAAINAQKASIVKELSYDWLVYNEASAQYEPYLPSYHGEVSQLHLIMGIKGFEPYFLKIRSSKASHYFINNQLQDALGGQGEITIPIRSLSYAELSGRVMITLYAEQGVLDMPKAYISKYASAEESAERTEPTPLPLPIGIGTRMGGLTLICFILLGTAAVLTRSSLSNFQVERIKRYASLFTKAKSETGRISAVSFLAFTGLYAAVLGYAIILYIPLPNVELFSWPVHLTGRFLYASAGLVAFVFIKTMLVYINTSLYNYQRGMNIHIKELMDVNIIYAMVLLALSALFHLSQLSTYPFLIGMASKAFFASFLASILVSYRINKDFPFKKVYLFSYLCATEFFPAFILIKLLQL